MKRSIEDEMGIGQRHGRDMALLNVRSKAAIRRMHQVAGLIEGAIWPPRSILTGQEVAGPGALTTEDWQKLAFITDPKCDSCGTPFEHDEGEGAICGACVTDKRAFGKLRSPLQYSDAARQLVLQLKRQGRREGLSLFADWMIKASGDILQTADVMVPVPLHYKRLASRGFNQAGWLANAIAKRTQIPVCHDAIVRRKHTPSQGTMNVRQRKRNVSGVFEVRENRRTKVAGKRVVLIDDVYTSGATVSACARILVRSGAANVDIVTLARVVRPVDTSI